MRRPPPLHRGARVALVSPAGPLGEADLQRAEDNARALGWDPVVGAHALARCGYLAGSDEERLHDLNAALADDSIDGIWCLRGGYGAMRLLERLDYAALRRRPKVLLGYSDITALHAALSTRAGVITFHGPTARAVLTPFSRRSLERALRGEESCGEAPDATALVPGRARGRLAGGNLAVLCALCGTPFAPVLDGAIVVLEDVGEAVYRIDRMLVQLRLAGLLTRCAGLVFGQFTEIPSGAVDERTARSALDELLREAAEQIGVPCMAGAPVGHTDDQWTLPLGQIAELDVDALTLRATHEGRE